MKRRLNIAVIMGGRSSEHEVSLETAKNVIEGLDKSKYNIRPVLITKRNIWRVGSRDVTIEEALKEVDIVFNAMHGEYGEDGTIQGLLDFMDVSYTGSGVLASALAMDKTRSKELFRLNGLLTPSNVIIEKESISDEPLIGKILDGTNLPLVVKPTALGSSVGVSIAESPQEAMLAINNVCGKINCDAMLEEYIEGREVTCGILENYDGQKHFPLAVTEIIPSAKHKFFNYEAKYDGSTKEIAPADLSTKLTKEIQKTAIKCHKILGCGGYSRTDMIITGGKIYVLELNSLPGLTQESLLPKGAAEASLATAAKVSGLTFSKLLDIIINSALKDRLLGKQ